MLIDRGIENILLSSGLDVQDYLRRLGEALKAEEFEAEFCRELTLAKNQIRMYAKRSKPVTQQQLVRMLEHELAFLRNDKNKTIYQINELALTQEEMEYLPALVSAYVLD